MKKILFLAFYFAFLPFILLAAGTPAKKKTAPAPVLTPAEKFQQDLKKLKSNSLSKIDSYLGRIDQMADALELALSQSKEIAQNTKSTADEQKKALERMDKSQSAFSVAKAAQGAGYAIREKTINFFKETENSPLDEQNIPDIKKLTKEIDPWISSIAEHYAKIKNEITKQKLESSLIR